MTEARISQAKDLQGIARIEAMFGPTIDAIVESASRTFDTHQVRGAYTGRLKETNTVVGKSPEAAAQFRQAISTIIESAIDEGIRIGNQGGDR